MNQIILIGRVTKDPELKYSQGGKAFCNFSLAVAREFNRDETDFINCVAWEKKAETIAQYFKKGQRIGIIGRIQIDKKDDTYYTKIIVEKRAYRVFSENETNATQNKKQTEEDDDFPF